MKEDPEKKKQFKKINTIKKDNKVRKENIEKLKSEL